MTTQTRGALNLALNLAILGVIGAIIVLFISGGYVLDLGRWQISSHRLAPLLRLLLPLVVLRLWLSLGWRELLLLLFSTGLALLLGEGVVRWVAPPLANPNMVQIHRPSAQLDWELVPGSGGVGVLGETIQINPAGFRDHNHALAKPPGSYRIAVVGDSFTFGMGVELQDTFHQQLARQLPAQVEVMAFGVAGYQLWQHLELLRQRVLDYQPDLVILALFLDDIEKTLAPHNDPAWQPHNPFAEILPAQPSVSRLWTLLSNLQRLMEVRYRYRGTDYLRGIEARKHSVDGFYRQVQSGDLPAVVYAQFRHTLGEIVGLVRNSGADCLVAYIPDASQLHDTDRQDINRRIAAMATELQVTWVDFTPVFEALEEPRELYLFPLDAHTSATGHALMADTLVQVLRNRELLAP